MKTRKPASVMRHTAMCAAVALLAVAMGTSQNGSAQQRGEGPPAGGGRAGGAPGRGRATYNLNDPVPNDPALKGAIDMHAHQDPDSFGPSYGQAARSIDALDLLRGAKASGMRGFVIKGTSIRPRAWPTTCASCTRIWKSSAAWGRT